MVKYVSLSNRNEVDIAIEGGMIYEMDGKSFSENNTTECKINGMSE